MTSGPTPEDPRRDLDGPPDGPPEFGPSGYLPERASKRARKIVLRAPLGMHWVWAAIVAGAFVLIAGVVFLTRAGDAPTAPFRSLGPLDAVTNGEVREVGDVVLLLVTEGGRPRAFDVTGMEEPPVFCPDSRRLEGPGRVWSLTGRGAGTPSLEEFPTLVSDGTLYVDVTDAEPAAPATDAETTPACVT